MSGDTQTLIAKIQALPAERQAEVEDFVDFIATKERRLAALDRLLAIAPALEAAGAPRITEEEIADELKTARAERRSHKGTGRGLANELLEIGKHCAALPDLEMRPVEEVLHYDERGLPG